MELQFRRELSPSHRLQRAADPASPGQRRSRGDPLMADLRVRLHPLHPLESGDANPLVDLGCSLGLPLLGSFSSLRICLNSLVPLLRPPQPLPMPDRARTGSSDSTAAPQQQPTEITVRLSRPGSCSSSALTDGVLSCLGSSNAALWR